MKISFYNYQIGLKSVCHLNDHFQTSLEKDQNTKIFHANRNILVKILLLMEKKM